MPKTNMTMNGHCGICGKFFKEPVLTVHDSDYSIQNGMNFIHYRVLTLICPDCCKKYVKDDTVYD